MGYTHYWNVSRDADAEKLEAARVDIARIVEASTVPLADGHGTPGTKPVLSDVVLFNGVGGDAHETFVWPPNLSEAQAYLGDRDEVFTFCKTAYKPYDTVVVACLLRAKYHLGDSMRLSTDAADAIEFLHREQSAGWGRVNAMLGHPVEQGFSQIEGADVLYERVFGESPSAIISTVFEEVPA
jgi:hypothetical protein